MVDLQNDFMPGGALAIPDGDAIVPGINGLMRHFQKQDLTVVLTQDWHPAGHQSFASAHEGYLPYDEYIAPGLGPVVWPDHCVQGTQGARFHPDLNTDYAQAIMRKGTMSRVDSYSAFVDNDKRLQTGLDGYLRVRRCQRLFFCGLAFDYCVLFSALDGVSNGYEVCCVEELTRAVGAPADSVEKAHRLMHSVGVKISGLQEILE